MSRSGAARLPSARRKLADTALERPADLPRPPTAASAAATCCAASPAAVICLTAASVAAETTAKIAPRGRRPPCRRTLSVDVGPDEVIVGVPGGAPADLAVPEDDLSALVEHTRREARRRRGRRRRSGRRRRRARLTSDWRLRWYRHENATQPPALPRTAGRPQARRAPRPPLAATRPSEEPAAAAAPMALAGPLVARGGGGGGGVVECSLLQQTYHVDDGEPAEPSAARLQARWTSLGCNATAPTGFTSIYGSSRIVITTSHI